jgi:hypothetical protein
MGIMAERPSTPSHTTWGQERLGRMLTRELLHPIERALLPGSGTVLTEGERITLSCESQHIGRFELTLSRSQGRLAVRVQVASPSLQAQMATQRHDIENALRGIGQAAVAVEFVARPTEKRKARRHAATPPGGPRRPGR